MQVQTNREKDLELLRKHEEIINKYKELEKAKQNHTPPYRHLAYQVKNPFKGV